MLSRPTFLSLLFLPAFVSAELPRQVSGIYPSLAMFNDEGECGTGAVVPWAGKLWVVTYAPHQPKGSSDKLYEISPELIQKIRPESIGGTPANRMIHEESQQLFMGPHVIDKNGGVRTIPYAEMFGRPTGLARHLTDPAGKITLATMEEGCYEIDVKTLAVKELWGDEAMKNPASGRHSDLPGYHGKGFYSSQGRYVYANNGDHAAEARSNPAVPSGVLAEWDGQADKWTVIRRNQFTEVTGPGGIFGGAPNDPLWTIGWDHRSLILMMLDGGKWQSFRLPKGSHSYDGAHGWNTEWPRIREIGQENLLMTMHGTFWHFPKNFRTGSTAGILPRSNYLKVIGDFCHWNGRLVFGCDDAAKSEFLNKSPLKGDLGAPGQSQSNLWFTQAETLDHLGPILGRGALWIGENVDAYTTSDPYLLAGYQHRWLQLSHEGAEALTLSLEVDEKGTGAWKKARDLKLPPHGKLGMALEETGAWLRLVTNQSATKLTAALQYRADDKRPAENSSVFAGVGNNVKSRGTMLARGEGLKTLRFVSADQQKQAYDLTADLQLLPVSDAAGAAWTATHAAIPETKLTVDAASALYTDSAGKRWRLPKGTSTEKARICREICTERNLLNAAGSFYELPAENAGGFPKIRPVATHNLAIYDYASYRGLLVISGISSDTQGEHIVRSADGQAALWVGNVEDLWSLGKPRGQGSVWQDTEVKAGEPSDPYLCTGFDEKSLTVSTDAKEALNFTVEADFLGTGDWQPVTSLAASETKPAHYDFPKDFGAYWLRLVPQGTAKVTATFDYR